MYNTQLYTNLKISIHAPTRGATVKVVCFLSFLKFQSTLLQEERRSFANGILASSNFNPRSYKRSDID